MCQRLILFKTQQFQYTYPIINLTSCTVHLLVLLSVYPRARGRDTAMPSIPFQSSTPSHLCRRASSIKASDWGHLNEPTIFYYPEFYECYLTCRLRISPWESEQDSDWLSGKSQYPKEVEKSFQVVGVNETDIQLSTTGSIQQREAAKRELYWLVDHFNNHIIE